MQMIPIPPEPTRDELVEKLRRTMQQMSCGPIGNETKSTIALWANSIQAWNASQGFWEGDRGENPILLKASKIALEHSELSERLEAIRKPGPSDHIPTFSGEEEEWADALIRLLDYAGKYLPRAGEAFLAKLEYNLTRPYKHGKAI